MQASGAGGSPRRVTVRVTEDDGARLDIHNTGAAIPQEALDRVFEPFFTTREKGTGLGLAFVHEIVRDHGGSVRVESDAETGTRFVLRLPPTSATA